MKSCKLVALGLTAAALTTVSMGAQVVKTLETHSTQDISLAMYIILTAGLVLWLVYGFLVKDLPLVIANIFSTIFVVIVLVCKIMWG